MVMMLWQLVQHKCWCFFCGSDHICWKEHHWDRGFYWWKELCCTSDFTCWTILIKVLRHWDCAVIWAFHLFKITTLPHGPFWLDSSVMFCLIFAELKSVVFMVQSHQCDICEYCSQMFSVSSVSGILVERRCRNRRI